MREDGDSSESGAEARIHGWCPSAWRPMMAGDGLLVRVRPAMARLTRDQALGLCGAASAFGNGAIDLTNRGGLQIRGVAEAGLAGLLDRLVALGLIAGDPAAEAYPVILAAPDWTEGDGTEEIARALAHRLPELPPLPGKTGFAVDIAGAPVLTSVSTDFRIERSAAGGLLVRAEGRERGIAVSRDDAVETLLSLARWFAETGGAAGRMARHRAPLPPELSGAAVPAAARSVSDALGPVHGAAFGRIDATDFAALIGASDARAIRVTPWRRLILEGASARPPAAPDNLLRIDACVGAPACPQATVETRALALRLAPHVQGSLHVSGCAKGCARPSPADRVLTGRGGAFDLGHHKRAGEAPDRLGLTPAQILALLGAD